MNKLTVVFTIAFYSVCQLLTAQTSNYTAKAINPALLKNAGSVVRERTLKIEIDDKEEAELVYTYAVTVLNRDGESENTWYESEDKFEKLKSFECRLYDAAGAIIRTSTKKDIEEFGDFSTYGFSDAHFKKLSMYDAQYPYTVVFSMKKSLDGFFRFPGFTVQQTGQSTEYARLEVEAPNDYQFKWKGVRTDVQPVKKTSGKKTYWSWTFRDLPAVSSERYVPFRQNTYAEILVTPVEVEIDDFEGSFENWQTMGRFFYEMNKDRDELSPDLQNKVQTMTAGVAGNRTKIDSLYRYVQRTCRYVSIQLGIGGWQTFDARFVETKKYGDCKALTNYMKALLKSAGIEAYMALVYGDDDGAPDLYDDAPVPMFNHVILYIPSENMWLECTSNNAPPGYLGEFTSGRPVLLLTPEGGKKINTPELDPEASKKLSTTVIHLTEDGKATVKSHIMATGVQQEHYRSLEKNYKKEDREKAFAGLQEIPTAQIRALEINASEIRPETKVNFEGTFDGYSTKSGKRIFVPLNKIHPFKRSLPADDNRQHDIVLSAAYIFCDTVTIYFPEGYKVENSPATKSIESEYGTYEIAIKTTENSAIITRSVVMPKVTAPATAYQEIRKIYTEIGKTDAMQLVLFKP